MRTKSTLLSNLTLMTLAGLLNLALVTHANAQMGTIPLSTVESPSLNGSQQSQIADFVAHWSQRASGADSQQTSRAKAKLVEPLINSRVSISFRRAYSDALNAYIDQLQSNADIGSTMLALRLSGELGTTRATKMVLAGLNSDDLGTRVFAAGRIGRIFRTTAANGPALSASDLNSLITELESIADSQTDESVLSAAIQALGVGSTLPSNDFLAQRSRCIIAMCNAASAQLMSDDSDLESRVRIAMLGAGAATNSLFQNGEDSTEEAVKASVELGANMISVALSEVIHQTIPGVDGRSIHVASVRSGESLLYFALRKHAELHRRPVDNVQQTAFADLLQAGEDRDFRNQAALLLGPGSPINTTFGFADDAFVN